METWLSVAIKPLLTVVLENNNHLAKDFLTAIADYIICGSAFRIRKVLKKLPDWQHSSSLMRSLLDKLDGYHGSLIWRAMVQTVRNNGHYSDWADWDHEYRAKLVAACKLFGVFPRDVIRVWRYMSLPSQKKIIKIANNKRAILQPLTEAKVNKLMSKTFVYATNLAKRKLKFISDNDAGGSIEDFAADLMLHAARALRKGEWFANSMGTRHDRSHILNYLKRTISNRAISIIEFNTSMMRQRIKRISVAGDATTTKPYTDVTLRDGKIVRIQVYPTSTKPVPEFQRTTLSMDLPTPGSAFSTIDPDEGNTYHDHIVGDVGEGGLSDKLHWREVAERLGGAAKYLLAVMLNHECNDELDRLAWQKYGAKGDSLDPERYFDLICEYCNVKPSFMRKLLRSTISEHICPNNKKMKRERDKYKKKFADPKRISYPPHEE